MECAIAEIDSSHIVYYQKDSHYWNLMCKEIQNFLTPSTPAHATPQDGQTRHQSLMELHPNKHGSLSLVVNLISKPD
jgi:hypothetical protein